MGVAYTPTRMKQKNHDIQDMDKPSVSSLIAHIISFAFSSSMISLLALVTAIIVFLEYHNIATGNYFALLFGTVFVAALLRGCKAWQQELNDYQKSLTGDRHTYNSQAH